MRLLGWIQHLHSVSYLTTSTAFSDKYCTCTSYLTWPHQQPFRTNTVLVHRILPDHINSLFGQILYLYSVSYLTTSTAFSDKYCSCTSYLTWPHQQPFRTNTVLVHRTLPDHINSLFGQILYLYIVSYLTTSTAFSDKYCTCTSYLTWPHQQPFWTNTVLVHRILPDHINSLFGQILYLYIISYLTTSTAFSDKYCTCTSFLTWPHQQPFRTNTVLVHRILPDHINSLFGQILYLYIISYLTTSTAFSDKYCTCTSYLTWPHQQPFRTNTVLVQRILPDHINSLFGQILFLYIVSYLTTSTAFSDKYCTCTSYLTWPHQQPFRTNTVLVHRILPDHINSLFGQILYLYIVPYLTTSTAFSDKYCTCTSYLTWPHQQPFRTNTVLVHRTLPDHINSLFGQILYLYIVSYLTTSTAFSDKYCTCTSYLTWPHQQPFWTNTVLVHRILPDHINSLFGQILYLYIVSYLTTSTAFSDKYCTCTSYLTWPHQQPFRTNTVLVHRILDDQTQVDSKPASQPEHASLNQCQLIAANRHPQLVVEIRFLCNVIDARALIGPCSHVTSRCCLIWYSWHESSM